MKKILLILIFSFSLFTISCNQNQDSSIDFNETINVFKVNESFILNSYINSYKVHYESKDESIITLIGNRGIAKSAGDTVICAYDESNNLVKKYIVRVKMNTPTYISLSGGSKLKVNDTLQLYLESDATNVDVIWESNNENVATVDEGIVTAKAIGFVTITAYYKNDKSIYDQHQIWIENNILKEEYLNDQYQNSSELVDLSSMKGILEPIIKKTKTSVVGVLSFNEVNGIDKLLNSGTGVIYKRLVILDNGNETLENNGDGIYYRYYVITSKSVIKDSDNVTVYYDDKEHNAKVIAVDEKVDIGVITFDSQDYFSVATFGDSNDLKTGEFVIAFGNTFGSMYANSSSFGVVSYNSRYVSTDTDGDETNDWDALYIQHDAAIGDGSSGGPLVNMKGEIIGINSVMISADEIDNMAFAIPINLVLELVGLLEKGIVPTRPLLLISVISVRDILKNDYLLEYYPVPSGLTYGMFVAEVTEGGVGSAAGMLKGDIIVEFDGKKITYSYELRMMLNEVIIGSNQEHIIIVNRNNTLVTLKVVF